MAPSRPDELGGRGEVGEKDDSAERQSISPSSFVGASGFLFGDRDRKTVKLRLRKGFTKYSFGSPNGNDSRNDDGGSAPGGNAQDNDAISSATLGGGSSPIIPEIDSKTMALFPTGKPRETVLDTVICKHCKKPVLRIGAVEHIRGCYKAKQEKQRRKKEARDAANKLKHGEKEREKSKTAGDDDNEEGDIPSVNGSTKASKKSALEDIGGNKKGKKRKTDNGDDKENASGAAAGTGAGGGTVKKKKKKDEPKKTSKFKGPVDVERQCGVQLPNGGQCARSLTCKSHSMGAKRAVPGRSLPYDMLLQAYQKKNQARQQKAAIDANAPVVDEDDGSGKVDSDEEKEQCMMGIERMWTSREAGSLAGHRLVSTRMKYRMARVRDMFRQAIGGDVPGVLGGGNGAGLFGGGTAGGPFGGFAADGPFGSSGGGMPLNIFGPDTFMLNKQRTTTNSLQPTGHSHGQPASAANVPGSQPQSATAINAPALPSPTVGHHNIHRASDSMSPRASPPVSMTGHGNAAWRRQGSVSMSQQAQVNAATAAAAAAAAAANNPAKKVPAQA